MSDYNYLNRAGVSALWARIKSYISSLGYTTNKGTVGGSGTSGYLAKWTGTTAVGNGPQLGNSTVTFLRNDGNWAEPSGTITKIQKNGSDLTISNKTVNIIVPTSVSQLSNDSGFVTTNTTYAAGTGISLSGTTFSNSGVTGVKGGADTNYKTGNVSLTYSNIGAIGTRIDGNTQQLYRPKQLQGLTDVTLDSKINTLRANRLAFLPADQVIIEKTTNGGTTWQDAGVSNEIKAQLFAETRPSVNIPLLNGVKSTACGLRVTFTAMKYNVPNGTGETAKYNYWNSNYVTSQQRYNQLKEMYFWVNANSDGISIKAERATGANSTNWSTIFENNNWVMRGWSGNDYIRFTQAQFGGGTNQPNQPWNYRLTFFTKGPDASSTLSTTFTTSHQSILEIRGYGDAWWSRGTQYAANDKIYQHDYNKNVTFPANITANQFIGTATSASIASTAKALSTILPVTNGGTGSSTAAAARTALGLGSAAVATTSASVGNNSNLPIGSAIQSYVTGLGYEANQNAFTTVKVDTTDLVADSKTDTLTITAGNNITLTPTASSDSFSIAATNTTYAVATTAANGLMSATDKATLDGLISSGGEVNQNAFSNVVVGSSTVAADQKTDTLTLVGSGSVSLSANTSTDTITISGTNTTYGTATTAAAGLMSVEDKIKIDKTIHQLSTLSTVSADDQIAIYDISNNITGKITLKNVDEFIGKSKPITADTQTAYGSSSTSVADSSQVFINIWEQGTNPENVVNISIPFSTASSGLNHIIIQKAYNNWESTERVGGIPIADVDGFILDENVMDSTTIAAWEAIL